MKKLLLSFVLFVFAGSFLIAQDTLLINVSGHIVSNDNNLPVGNHEVIVEIEADSIIDSYVFITNDDGYYEGVIYPRDYEGSIIAMTYDCNEEVIIQDEYFNPANMSFVFDFEICTDEVPPPGDCIADFTYEVVPAERAVFFEDTSEGDPAFWLWDFGDGETSVEQNPVHMYYEPGIFNVCLTISSQDTSCYDMYCQEVNVDGNIPDCENFFWYDFSGELSLEFFGEVIPDQDAVFFWDFGDGANGNGQNVEHTYAEAGYYMVTLETVSGDSCYAVSMEDIWIDGGGNDCENWFWYDTYDNISFDFFGESYFIDAEDYVWDFGDGEVGYGQEVGHTYDVEPGYYLVTLSTFAYTPNGDSCFAVSAQEVWVGDDGGSPCESWFWFEQMDEVTFSFVGELFEPRDDAEFMWDFGDGEYAYGQEVIHAFDPANGTEFEVCLTTTVNYGDSCSYTSCEEVLIGGQMGDNLYGTIFTDDNLTADYAVVGLFGIEEEGSFVYDMVLTDPYTGFYNFEDVPEGDYYLIASLVPGSEFYLQYFPTYFEEALFWWNADVISLGEVSNPYNIQLIPTGFFAPGPGMINGGISFPDKGDGLSNISIIIMDENENPIQYVYSDEDGFFAFENLGLATYKLKVDIPNIESEVATVVLSENNQNANVEFFFGEEHIYLGVNQNISQFDLSAVYPNPVKDVANISLGVESNTTVEVSVYNAVGQLLQSFNIDAVQGTNQIKINVADLSSGVYHVRLTTDTWTDSQKFIK